MSKRTQILSAIAVTSSLMTVNTQADEVLDLVIITGQSLCTQYPFTIECGGSGVGAPGDDPQAAESERMVYYINATAPAATKKLIEDFKAPCIKAGEPDVVYIERATKECYNWALDAVGWPVNAFGSVKAAALAGCQTRIPEFQMVAIERNPTCGAAG